MNFDWIFKKLHSQQNFTSQLKVSASIYSLRMKKSEAVICYKE